MFCSLVSEWPDAVGLHAQEWASSNQVTVPHKENRVNASQLYKGGDEETPNNILQVRQIINQ